jgi:hypothetical protein
VITQTVPVLSLRWETAYLMADVRVDEGDSGGVLSERGDGRSSAQYARDSCST